MTTSRKILIGLAVFLVVAAALLFWLTRGNPADLPIDAVTGDDPTLAEPQAEAFPTVQIAEPVGWADGQKPGAAAGLQVVRFADGLDHPRVLHTLPNGDVLVTLTRAPKVEKEGGGIVSAITDWVAGLLMSKAGATGESPDQLVLLRDADGDGVAETRKVLRDDLASPSGIAWRDGKLYVANHNALLAFDYAEGADAVTGAPRKLMDLPPGGNHWMRNIVLSPDGTKIYVAVGSASNIGERGM